ncbi:MAG: Proteasome-activating nucleotidase [Candidatus Methanofastidiosum methylothiophilum]|uniref:Proteasome-activating nucleotidase n=1 Tax=Candidatus Methanofastidiosum methylothiophilum TaxID=1705564 RepID=A0A150J055_9EURY|nr:MAG: Proteasome-activating nucleotidase [Candidatus Methanofastidiosum methylthiophilus]KYC48134.1 MAG: Proteasome-activating nucleotidase [Candidatus Methanofastidiosum methylthiophilus]KYC50627.1 MAG: Proteasome-activating nucleotidase [Candidatus Methanofastidiosum methylthiophilus]
MFGVLMVDSSIKYRTKRLDEEDVYENDAQYNDKIIERLKLLEIQNRSFITEKLKLEKEVESLKSELERLNAPPLITGVVVEAIDPTKVIIKSSSGPKFVVGVSSKIDLKDLIPGALVACNQRNLSIMEVLPSTKDPEVCGMEVLSKTGVTYFEIGGLREQITKIKETVELPLKKPELFDKVGIEPPHGVLLHGPPGNGKTLIVKAVANETDSTFIRVVGSEFVRKYIGEGARMVREVFNLAREKSPSILFIDEIDAIGARRVDTGISGDREVARTMMQLLAELDGFDPRGQVKIIGATNRVDMLDPALLRPGRFDRLIEITPPTREECLDIFKIHSRNMNIKDLDYSVIIDLIDGLSGAEIRSLCTEAGMAAIREDRDYVTSEDFKCSVSRITSSECQNNSLIGMYG